MAKSKGQLEEMLAEMGQKMDQLIADMKDNKDQITKEMEAQIKELRKSMDDLKDDSKGFGDKAKERWEHARPHLDEAMKEIGQAFKRFTGK